MLNKHAANQKGSPASHSIRPTYIHLGIDGTGAIHCWNAPTNTVHVIYNGRRRQRIPIDAVEEFDDVDHYVARIGADRDWRVLSYGWRAYLGQLREVI